MCWVPTADVEVPIIAPPTNAASRGLYCSFFTNGPRLQQRRAFKITGIEDVRNFGDCILWERGLLCVSRLYASKPNGVKVEFSYGVGEWRQNGQRRVATLLLPSLTPQIVRRF